ncbi:MFS transporter [Streptomyces qinzhouensis]|uniref:MFS transporter n=1 Tax=Streptomyces qinzhouensis TaxID=2599401 RepID=A0A5B8J9W1_9ACTN|nr:MFS transporter [Streptomyces qinzhouensis]QDY76691.1 MFS transporter [Streptomyces qinzhouensis]
MSTTSTPLPAPPGSPASSKDPGTDNRPGALLALVLAAQFMALLDVFVVHVAAPTIRTELGASSAQLQLVVAGYTVAYAILLITGARLGELIGHRRAWLAGLALFTAASLACGLAAETGQLIAFRLVQGAGAALLIPQVLSLIQRNFTGEARVRALGAYAAVLAVGAVAGLVAGGLLVSADLLGLGWRPVFLINVPIGAVLLVLGARVLPPDRPAGRGRGLDLPGLVLFAAVVGLFTVPLVLGQEHGWPAWTWSSLVATAVLLAVFLVYEARPARRGGAPLIAPRVLRIPGMGTAVARIALAMAVNAGCVFALTLHLQNGLGYGALRAGLTALPTALAFGVTGLTWRRLPASLQPALVPGGFAVTALALLASGVLLRDGDGGGLPLYAALAALGAGLAAAYSPALAGALATVRTEDAADASGLLVTVTQLGQIVGVAAFGSFFLDRRAAFGQGGAVGAAGSADAWWWVAAALAAASVAGTFAGLVRKRS